MSAQSFLSRVGYSSVNEDWRTEQRGLAMRPSDRVLCVTGSGDRVLDLLAAAPVKIVAIDMNQAQNHLLRLKIAALRELSFDDYSAFLGLTPASKRARRATFERLAPSLPPATAAYFKAHLPAVSRGLLYSGHWERYFQRIAALGQLLRPRLMETLFSFDDIEAQRRFVDAHWDNLAWRLIFRAQYHRWLTPILFGDPAFYAHVTVPVGDFLYQRVFAALRRFVARENFMLSLTLQGRLPQFDLPPYLTREGWELIRTRLDGIEVVDAELLSYLERSDGARFDRFSLSDVTSYIPSDHLSRLLRGIASHAERGARLVLRQFLARAPLPDEAARYLRREPELEHELELADHSFAYSFIVGQVAGTGS